MMSAISQVELPPWEASRPFHHGTAPAGFVTATRSRGTRAASVSPMVVTEGSGLTRRGILYDHVRRHPGTHVRRIGKELGLQTGDLQYHLLWLERNGYVKTRKVGFFRVVFPTMLFNDDQEVILGILSQETPREILLCLLREPSLTQRDLAERLGFSQPTVSWHMDRLFELGIVRKSRKAKGILYEIVASPREILGFVEAYHPRAWTRWSHRLIGATATSGVTHKKDAPQGTGLARSHW
jgi:DNA-binding transcriptional ArsR family regulator